MIKKYQDTGGKKMEFKRGIGIDKTLDLGIKQNIPIWMKPNKDFYNYKDYRDVWTWALEIEKKEYDIIFPYIVSQNGKIWYEGINYLGEVVNVSSDSNQLLWESVSEGNLVAVEALLTVPNLFPEEAMSLEFGTTLIKEINPSTGKPYRTALFGNIVALAKNKRFTFLVDPLEKYYHEECNRFQKRK